MAPLPLLSEIAAARSSPAHRGDNIAILVSRYLHLYMPRPVHKFFKKYGVIPKGVLCFAPASGKDLFKFFIIAYYPHAPAATARRRLQHQWVSYPFCFRKGRIKRV